MLIAQSFELRLQPKEDELLFERYALAVAGYEEGTPERGELLDLVHKVWKRLGPSLRSSPRWLKPLAAELVRTVVSGGSLDEVPITVPALVKRMAERERERWGSSDEEKLVAEVLVGLAGLGEIVEGTADARVFLQCLASQVPVVNPYVDSEKLEKIVRLLFSKEGLEKFRSSLKSYFLHASLERYGEAFLVCTLKRVLERGKGDSPSERARNFFTAAERVQEEFEKFLSELEKLEPAVAWEEKHYLRRLFEKAWHEVLDEVLSELDCEDAAGVARVLCNLAELSKKRDQKAFAQLAEIMAQLAEEGWVRLARWGLQKLLELGRELSEQGQDIKAWLAMSLNSLGVLLSELGRREEALEKAEEATQIYRELAERNPEAFLPYLAGSLNNLGVFLSELGRRGEALKAAEEAVEIYRELAERNPEAFLPYLATSLNSLGNVLSELGRLGEALRATEEAFLSLLPFYLRYREAHGELMQKIVNSLRAYGAAGLSVSQEVCEKLAGLQVEVPGCAPAGTG